MKNTHSAYIDQKLKLYPGDCKKPFCIKSVPYFLVQVWECTPLTAMFWIVLASHGQGIRLCSAMTPPPPVYYSCLCILYVQPYKAWTYIHCVLHYIKKGAFLCLWMRSGRIVDEIWPRVNEILPKVDEIWPSCG